MKPIALKVKDAFDMIGVGITKGYQLINDGELESFKIGRSTRITMASVESYVEREVSRWKQSYQDP